MACDGKMEGGLWLLPWVEGGGAAARVVTIGAKLLVVGMGEGCSCNGGEDGGGAMLRLERTTVVINWVDFLLGSFDFV